MPSPQPETPAAASEERIAQLAAEIERIKLDADKWQKVEFLIYRQVKDWDIFAELCADLNLEALLIDHVPIERRFLVDKWLATFHRIDARFDHLDYDLGPC